MFDVVCDADELGLAPLFPIRGFEGSLSEYVERLYWQYRAMVDHAGIRLWGKPLGALNSTAGDGRDRLFWHLITSATAEHTEGTRRLDLKRCAHLPRIWALLEALEAGDPRACWWREGRMIFVAPVDFSMVVVLQRTRIAYLLKTAYPIRQRGRRDRLFNRAAKAWLSGACDRRQLEHPVWRAERTEVRRPAVCPRKCSRGRLQAA